MSSRRFGSWAVILAAALAPACAEPEHAQLHGHWEWVKANAPMRWEMTPASEGFNLSCSFRPDGRRQIAIRPDPDTLVLRGPQIDLPLAYFTRRGADS